MSSVVRNLKIMSFMSTFTRRKSTIFTRIGNVITYIITIANMILLNYAMHPPPLWIRIVRIAENGMNMGFYFVIFYGFLWFQSPSLDQDIEDWRKWSKYWGFLRGFFRLSKFRTSLASLPFQFASDATEHIHPAFSWLFKMIFYFQVSMISKARKTSVVNCQHFDCFLFCFCVCCCFVFVGFLGVFCFFVFFWSQVFVRVFRFYFSFK